MHRSLVGWPNSPTCTTSSVCTAAVLQDRDGPKALDEFCRDLCAEVRQNKIDPVIGREREVARVMQILARRTKNNPILLGEPGGTLGTCCRAWKWLALARSRAVQRCSVSAGQWAAS